ncbi:LacI family DNA-binding transcriptional regulator [Microbacterium sp. MPKO10]|uniref:LacI family DNA-binding transcriptional regulator n=1 Tax=Microbacterium sp. MPKO10 TaxID=2989818 RepID=UPI0022367601|nr:substrate-binding domain-containing protein [Microbacterium sp. MPKO10]MCW4456987.1 substrate-binding domain-containing protein [Microbacterium sp. MPKO10]
MKSVGLCLHVPRRRVPMEPFWMNVIRGIEDGLAESGLTLLVQVVQGSDDEVVTLERWRRDDSVAGVVIADLLPDDPRLKVVREHGLPAVIMARPEDAPGLPTVAAHNAQTMSEAIGYLVDAGHTAIARVTGPERYVHTQLRSEAFDEAGAQHGIRTLSVEADFTSDDGARATRELIDGPESPTAVLYDNDVMALAGLEVLSARGLSVPGDVAIMAWDDSVHCQLAHPPVTAFNHDLQHMGLTVADALLRVLDGDTDVHVQVAAPRLVERASTLVTRAGAA